MAPNFTIDDARLPQRFWSKVSPEPNSGCWLWTAARHRTGYGSFSIAGRWRSSHRLAYETLVGPIPDGLVIDHLCREPACCNPAHLDPVTNQENCRRGEGGILHTHCPQGHELTPWNTARNTLGNRYCRTCRRDKYEPVAPDNNRSSRLPKTHCKRGHLLAETARPLKSGKRKCLVCSNMLQRALRAKGAG